MTENHIPCLIQPMATPDGIYVLYRDAPARRYRRIAAKCEQSACHLQFLVETTEGEPFDLESGEVQVTLCATLSEAVAKADEERELCLQNGWREYPDASL